MAFNNTNAPYSVSRLGGAPAVHRLLVVGEGEGEEVLQTRAAEAAAVVVEGEAS